MNEEQKNQELTNLEYDLVTIVHKKAKAVKAYETYLRDAGQSECTECVNLINKIREDDLQHLANAKIHLQETLADSLKNR